MEIEFVYSGVYDRHLLRKEDTERKSRKEFQKKIQEIKSEWSKNGEKILSEISRVTGLEWKEDKIKCYVVTKSVPFSEPLTIPAYEETDYFADVLIHELIHQIFMQGDNYQKSKKAWDYFFNKYKDESWKTKIHIPLHSVHTHIYLKFFSEERLNRDVESVKKYAHSKKDYMRSWEIVQKEGYKNIIEEFRERVKRN